VLLLVNRDPRSGQKTCGESEEEYVSSALHEGIFGIKEPYGKVGEKETFSGSTQTDGR